VITNTRSS